MHAKRRAKLVPPLYTPHLMQPLLAGLVRGIGTDLHSWVSKCPIEPAYVHRWLPFLAFCSLSLFCVLALHNAL